MIQNNLRINCFILSILILLTANAQADTLCGKITIKKGKAKFVTRLATTSCPKGYQVLLNLAQIATAGPQGPKGDPGPGVTNGSVGPLQLDSLPGVRVRRSASQMIPSATFTNILFDTEEYDDMGFFVPTGDTITIPLAGTYFVSGGVAFGPHSAGVRSTFILKNGASIAGQNTPEPGVVPQVSLSTVNRFKVGDTIKLAVIQNSGVSLGTFNVDPGDVYLAVQWIAP